MILKESFESTRWELTHEAAGLLGNACSKLQGIEEDKLVGPGSLSRDDVVHGSSNGYGHGNGNGHSRSGLYRENTRGHLTVANAARV